MRAEEAYQRYRAKGKDRRGGRLGPNTVPKPYTPPHGRRRARSTPPIWTRGMVKGQHGFLQGYNAQAAANEHQIVIAAEIEVVSPDFGHLERTVTAARRELDGRRRHRAARTWSSPTPATGTPSRCNASPATASRS